MSWVDKLERKCGRYAIRNISRYLVIAVFIGYLLSLFSATFSFVNYLTFDAYSILHGQIWRLLTWVFAPPTSSSLLMLLFLLCLLPMGSTLESILGTFRMNIYIVGGIILSDVGGFLVYGISRLAFPYYTFSYLGNEHPGFPVYLSAYYILLSIFMALALCEPEEKVNLYFILPIKMKWMLLVYALELFYEIYAYFRYGWVMGFRYGTEIILALVNLAVFFIFAKSPISFKTRRRNRQFKKQYGQSSRQKRAAQNRNRAEKNRTSSRGSGKNRRQEAEGGYGRNINPGGARHKCLICGRTELSNPELTFRYCSKCAGACEYCQDHLFTHEHKKGV